MKDTIFERSTTSLVTWFRIVYDFCNDIRGVSALSISKKYKLTYKTAWRICHKIREGISSLEKYMLDGIVGIDETFIGGKRKLMPGTELKGIGNKDIAFGLHGSNGGLRMFHILQKDAQTIRALIEKSIQKGATIHHDNNGTYGDLEKAGYKHKLVGKKNGLEFRRGVHNNHIETAWSRLKNRFMPTYTSVSSKHLQAYLDEFTFRDNHSKLRYTIEFIPVLWRLCLKEG